MAMSDYTENKVIDLVFRGRAWTPPSVIAIGLFTSETTDAGGGTEVSGGAYARAQLNPSDTNWESTQGTAAAVESSGTSGATRNAVQIPFPAPTGNWGLITHFAIFDALTGGNVLFRGALTTPKTVNSGDPAPVIAVGALGVTLS